MSKDVGFYHLQENIKKQLLDRGLDASKKEVHKAGEFLKTKIADAITKSSNYNIEKKKPVEEIIIPPEKREEILNKLRKVLYKWNTINKYINY